VNEEQPGRVVEKTEQLLGSLSGKRIAILGLSFKKDTDDIREAAPLKVIRQLRGKGAAITAFDPMALHNTKRVLGDEIEYAENPRSALKGADLSIIMTEWEQFRKLKAKDFQTYMKNPNVIDARRLYDPNEFRELNYLAVGLGP